MVCMGLMAETGALALALVVASNGVFAAPKCATSTEVTAIQAAAIQQQLMVAALTCNQVTSFNQFQTSYNKELRGSDAALLHMFRRLYGGRGEAEYHSFKTRLANDSSLHSIHDNAAYCQAAGMVFQAALVTDKPTLESFVSGIEVTEQGPVDSCGMQVAVGFAGAVPAVSPKPNPLRVAALAAPEAAAAKTAAVPSSN